MAAAKTLAADTREERLVEDGNGDSVVDGGSSLGSRERIRSLLSHRDSDGSRDNPVAAFAPIQDDWHACNVVACV